MPAHKIEFYLNVSTSLRALSAEVQRIAELQRVLVRIAPQPLAQACCVKRLRAGNLVLLAENAAVAAKLRQLAPRLLTAYGKQGVEVTSIRIEVQVSEAAVRSQTASSVKRLSHESIANLRALIDGLEESPLRAALEKLAARGS